MVSGLKLSGCKAVLQLRRRPFRVKCSLPRISFEFTTAHDSGKKPIRNPYSHRVGRPRADFPRRCENNEAETKDRWDQVHQVSVWIEDCQSFPILNILVGQSLKQRGLSSTRFPDKVHVGASITPSNAKDTAVISRVRLCKASIPPQPLLS